MIGERQFNLMKKNAVLIDSTRAEIVDPKALKEALENGKLATAALDSYYKEPVPMKENDSWGLLSLSDTKFIITPHTGYGSEEAFRNMNNMVIANLTAFSEGKKVPYSVN
jgi:phosphoglycerate dehydrogenase-like enzyme